MKLRTHKGNKSYKITWSQRIPRVVESHLNSDGTLRKVVTGGEIKLQRAVYTAGDNPTATLNAFLFGRDRTNITATITEWFPAACAVVSVPAKPCIPCRRPGVRRPSMQMLAYVVALSSIPGIGGGR